MMAQIQPNHLRIVAPALIYVYYNEYNNIMNLKYQQTRRVNYFFNFFYVLDTCTYLIIITQHVTKAVLKVFNPFK